MILIHDLIFYSTHYIREYVRDYVRGYLAKKESHGVLGHMIWPPKLPDRKANENIVTANKLTSAQHLWERSRHGKPSEVASHETD